LAFEKKGEKKNGEKVLKSAKNEKKGRLSPPPMCLVFGV
jgi:hypothetical protein